MRALRSIKCNEDKAKDIKCSEMVKDKVDKVKDRERAAETGQRGHQAPRGHLLRVNSCSHLPTTTATNIKGEIQYLNIYGKTLKNSHSFRGSFCFLD